MYILGMVILVFFAVIGVAVFVSMLVRANMKCDSEGFILLIPHVDEQNAEARIRTAEMLMQSAAKCRIVCVCEDDSPARKICEKMQRQYPRVEIVNEYGV